jgi:glycosyltransferase involved in cell wall biosynthesis
MKVTTSCCSRFHIFDQAAQLERKGVLNRLITGYPKKITRQWNIPDAKVTSLILNGIGDRILNKFSSQFSNNLRIKLYEALHNCFSKKLARHVPLDSDIFIGLSSYCLEALQKAKEKNIIAIVDHGSLHQRVERDLMIEESRQFSLTPEENLAADWIIEKEDKEFKTADHVMVLSQAAKNSLIKENIPAEKIFVNNCGVDLSSFSPKPLKKDDVFRIVFCGALTPRKGIYYLMQAFTELNLKNAELFVVGGAYDFKFKTMLEKFLRPNTRFISPVPQNQLSDIYNQSSIFVLPSIADGFGMVVPQAMACGLPVIVTDHVGAADVVTDKSDGFVIPIRDVDVLKEKIRELYEQPELIRAMSRAALAKSASLSWDAYGDRLVKFLTHVVNKKVK